MDTPGQVLPVALRSILRVASPGGRRGRLSVFIFHRVLPAADMLLPWEPGAAHFEWMVRLIADCYSVLPLGEAARCLADGKLPLAAASITFDDGYADNCTVALPILRRIGVPATFFIATGFLDGGRMFNDDVIAAARSAPAGPVDWREFGLGLHELSDVISRLRCYETVLGRLKYYPHQERVAVAREIARRGGLPDGSDLMMTSEQVTELRRSGMEIGGHTHTHPILESLPDDEAMRDIREGRERLEAITGERVSVFAYPNGVRGRDYSERHVAMVKSLGFSAAVSTDAGVARAGDDMYQLPRFTPMDGAPVGFALRNVRNLFGI